MHMFRMMICLIMSFIELPPSGRLIRQFDFCKQSRNSNRYSPLIIDLLNTLHFVPGWGHAEAVIIEWDTTASSYSSYLLFEVLPHSSTHPPYPFFSGPASDAPIQ